MKKFILLLVMMVVLLSSYTLPAQVSGPLRYAQLWDSIPADSGSFAVCLNPSWFANNSGEINVLFYAWDIDTLGPGTNFPLVYFYQTTDDNDNNYYYTAGGSPFNTATVLAYGDSEHYFRLTFGDCDNDVKPGFEVFGDSIFIEYNPRDAKSSGYISAFTWIREFN